MKSNVMIDCILDDILLNEQETFKVISVDLHVIFKPLHLEFLV